jgi:hypothetical protein
MQPPNPAQGRLRLEGFVVPLDGIDCSVGPGPRHGPRRGRHRRTRSHTTADLNRNLEEVVLEHTNSANKIAVVEVSGVIAGGEADRTGMDFVTYIKEQFKAAESDPDVKAVILKVDSPGGEVMASDESIMSSANSRTNRESRSWSPWARWPPAAVTTSPPRAAGLWPTN